MAGGRACVEDEAGAGVPSRADCLAHEVLDAGAAVVVRAGECVHIRGYPTCPSAVRVAWG